MNSDDIARRALRERRELQCLIRNTAERLGQVEEFLKSRGRHFALQDTIEDKQHQAPKYPRHVATNQDTFERMVRAILLEFGRPMQTYEIFDAFLARGYPLPSDNLVAFSNRLGGTRRRGTLVHLRKLGYWLAKEPLPEDAKKQAAQIRRTRIRQNGRGRRRALGNGQEMSCIKSPPKRPRGRPRQITEAQLRKAEELLRTGTMTRKEIGQFLGITAELLYYYFPTGSGKSPLVSADGSRDQADENGHETPEGRPRAARVTE